MQIASLYRYPVKGLSPEPLTAAQLTRGSYFPGDRLFAIENGPAGFDPAEPRHQPKIKFLMLMRDEALARLRTRYEDATATLVIESESRAPLRADLSTQVGRQAVEAFVRAYIPEALRGPPRVLAAPEGFRFTDSRIGYISLMNLASVAAVAQMAGKPVDPLRFRANVMLNGLEPWAEFDLVGRVIATGSGVRLKVTKRIVRCAATNVDPATGSRDVEIPAMLQRHLGHADCGIYAEILAGGAIAPGDTFALEPEEQGALAL